MGTIALVFVIWTSPMVVIYEGSYYKPDYMSKEFARVIDVPTAIIRGISIIGATLIIFFALKGLRIRQKKPGFRPEDLVPIKKETLMRLLDEMIELKKELLESLERERIRDNYLDKMK